MANAQYASSSRWVEENNIGPGGAGSNGFVVAAPQKKSSDAVPPFTAVLFGLSAIDGSNALTIFTITPLTPYPVTSDSSSATWAQVEAAIEGLGDKVLASTLSDPEYTEIYELLDL